MKSIKFKFFGVVTAAVFFAFSLVSCSQSANQNNKAEKANTETASAETAAKAKTGKQTISGEILDMSCYMDHGAKGQGHKKCAEACIQKKGLPAGILGEDGQVYLLIEDHDNSDAYETALQHAADDVSITGNVIVKNGVNSLVVEKVDAGDKAQS